MLRRRHILSIGSRLCKGWDFELGVHDFMACRICFISFSSCTIVMFYFSLNFFLACNLHTKILWMLACALRMLVTRKPNDFPSFVIEMAFTESAAKLACDAKWWLPNPGGKVKMVRTILITENPWKLELQCWEMVENIDPLTRGAPEKIPSST